MAAPVTIAHTHVHSLRIRSGAEALVARVLTADGVAGYGFTLNLEAAVARDMAAWDALARSPGVPFYALFGARRRDSIPVVTKTELPHLDPLAAGSVEDARSMARSAGPALALVAPNAHPWEIAFCAALAATLAAGRVCILVPAEPSTPCVAVPETAGVGVDWSLEPGFAAIRW